MGYDGRVPSATARATLRVALALLLAATLTGCVSTPLQDRAWAQRTSEHFEILSTYDETESERLAYELEQFRATLEFLLGREIPAGARRMRVIAFDGRSVERPFRPPTRERSYLVAGPEGETIVLRSALGWSTDAPTQLKLEVARRWIANAEGERLPPWLAEGMAQIASTIDVRGAGRTGGSLLLPVIGLLAALDAAANDEDLITVGVPRADHVRRLRQSQWVPIERVLGTTHLERWSESERELFEAESWAITHYLLFSSEGPEKAGKSISSIRADIARGLPPVDAALAALGDDAQRAVVRHVRADEFSSLVLKPADLQAPTAPVIPAWEDLHVALGDLSLAIGKPKQAERYFSDALVADAKPSRALAGLAVANARLGRRDNAERLAAEAAAGADGDPAVRRMQGDALRILAEDEGGSAQRERLATEAVEAYQTALELDPDDPASHYGLAGALLLVGDPGGAREAGELARRELPGDSRVRLVSARAALALGQRAEARSLALAAVTSARSRAELAEARALLARIDTQTALH